MWMTSSFPSPFRTRIREVASQMVRPLRSDFIQSVWGEDLRPMLSRSTKNNIGINLRQVRMTAIDFEFTDIFDFNWWMTSDIQSELKSFLNARQSTPAFTQHRPPAISTGTRIRGQNNRHQILFRNIQCGAVAVYDFFSLALPPAARWSVPKADPSTSKFQPGRLRMGLMKNWGIGVLRLAYPWWSPVKKRS